VKFPNLFIIGAMKAGTSSLHQYLDQHPDIFMSRMKEPQYFAPHRTRQGAAWGQGMPFPARGLDWYLDLFRDAGSARYAGESSVSYTAVPEIAGAERRIFEFNPNARLIYIMRDPVERAISHYWHFVVDGREDLPLLRAVRQRETYVARSDYALQLRPYLDLFGPAKVFTLTLEDFERRPCSVLQQVFQWLGLDPDVPIDTSRRFNVRGERVLQTRRYLVPVDTMLKHWRWHRLETGLPAVVPRMIRALTYREVDRAAETTEEARRALRGFLKPRVHELSQLLGRDFPEWSSTFAES
jgi:hypothetical protein